MKKFGIYIKKIFLLLLIVSITSNAYCTGVATGDDSSFITKKEFDKAFADFSNRLNQFETGINSKIDSQVSSYLDRNGIWSAFEQTVKNSVYTYNMADFSYWAAVANTITTGSNEHKLPADVLIEKTTKSGLLYYTFELAPSTGSDKRCCECFYWYDAYNNTTRYIAGSKYTTPCTTRCLDCTVMQTNDIATSPYAVGADKSDLTGISFGRATAQVLTDDLKDSSDSSANYDGFYTVNKSTNNLHHYINIPLVVSLGVRSCLTFVDKNKKIWIELKDTLSFTSTYMLDAMTNTNITKSDNSFGVLRLINNKAVIY